MIKNAMVINRETAMSLWNKSYGKSSKVKDFAGREMVKAAYNDRNSDYGWNIDHILPQSKGGKTTESNLICCHILTNDEKADKFPCFSANGKRFEIVKVENHYEIKEITKESKKVEVVSSSDEINYYDSAAGVRFFKSLKGIQNKTIFVGTITIKLENIKTTAIIDFIMDIFSDKNIFINEDYYQKVLITVKEHNLPKKEDITDLLDRCVLLNTYLGYYFKAIGDINDYGIFYGVHTLNKNNSQLQNKIKCLYAVNGYECNYKNYPLIINELVKINTRADQRIGQDEYVGRDKLNYDVYKYDYIYTNLSENLKKTIN